MRIRDIIWLAAAGFAVVGFASPSDAAKARHKKAAAHAPRHHMVRTAQPGSDFQGGVLKGPLYNGQDYLGDDPDPNIRSFLIRDKSRYGGPE